MCFYYFLATFYVVPAFAYSILFAFQALEVIKQLKETNTMNIQRAQMRLRVTLTGNFFSLFLQDSIYM